MWPEFVSEDFKSQWFYTMRIDAYHSDKTAISSTGLIAAHRSPLHYLSYLKDARKETLSMRIGGLLHYAALESEQYLRCARVMPNIDRRTKAGKDEYEAFSASMSAHEIQVTKEEDEKIKRMLEVLLTHPWISEVMKRSKKEVSGFFRDPVTSIKGRIRPDLLLNDDGIIADIKTTQDASRDGFAKSIARWRYDLQAAFYLLGAEEIDGRPYKEFYWIAIEKEPPFAVAVYRASIDVLNNGCIAYRKALENLEKAMRGEIYMGYEPTVQDVGLVPWGVEGEIRS